MNKRSILKKYKLNSATKWLMLGFSLVFLFATVTLEALEPENPEITVKILKNTTLVLTSVLGTNFLMSIALEVKSKNEMLTEFFANDVISSPAFYDNIPEDRKREMIKALETNGYFENDEIRHKMYANIREKINKYVQPGYYYKKHKFSVKVDVYSDYFEKTIVKTVDIRSYKDRLEVKEFGLIEVFNEEIGGRETFELKKVSINGVPLSKDKTKQCPVEYNDTLKDKKRYNEAMRHCLVDTIEFFKDSSTKITTIYKVRTPLHDTTASYRVLVPCEKFEIDYSVSSDLYKVSADACGCMEKADMSSNFDDNDSHVQVEFENYIFPYDGVSIYMHKEL